MNRRETPEFVFLDFGELLFAYDFTPATLLRAHKKTLHHINDRREEPISVDDLAAAHEATIKEYLTARKSAIEWPMDRIMVRMLDKLDLENISASAVGSIYAAHDHDEWPMETTVETVPVLASMASLNIISNLPHSSLRDELAKHNLARYFDTITVSGEMGYRKPHPRIYETALASAGATVANSMFLSHDEEEVEGARNVGMSAMLAFSAGEVLTKLHSLNYEDSVR